MLLLKRAISRSGGCTQTGITAPFLSPAWDLITADIYISIYIQEYGWHSVKFSQCLMQKISLPLCLQRISKQNILGSRNSPGTHFAFIISKEATCPKDIRLHSFGKCKQEREKERERMLSCRVSALTHLNNSLKNLSGSSFNSLSPCSGKIPVVSSVIIKLLSVWLAQ